jgi:hypothetical protein
MNRRDMEKRPGGLSVGTAAFLAALALGWMGCGQKPKVVEHTEEEGPRQKAPEEYLGLASDSLRAGATGDFNAWVTFVHTHEVVQHLNEYLTALGSRKPNFKLSPDREKFLAGHLHLDAAELAELKKPTFTPLDGHYLEFCALLSEALKTQEMEGLGRLEQARAGFDWVIRHINLEERVRPSGSSMEREDDLLPPQFVLQLGYGTAKERALVFLALMQQLGIDACMVAYPGPVKGQVAYWMPGVLIARADRDSRGRKVPLGIYLFDTRLGMPLPAADGRGIARLDEVMKEPNRFRSAFDPRGSRVIPAAVTSAEVHLACPLSALSPRARFLQEQWVAGKVNFAIDPVGLREAFAKLAKVPVRFWNSARDPNTPTRVLRAFLPPEEGGSDRSHRAARTPPKFLPWGLIHLRYPAQLHPKLHVHLDKRTQYYFQNGLWSRNLLTRGRVAEATKQLVQGMEILDERRSQFQEDTSTEEKKQRLDGAVKTWCEQMADAADAIERLRGEAEEQGRLQEAQKRLQDLAGREEEVLNYLGYNITADLVGKETSYLLALAMQERADQTRAGPEADSAWGEAHRWWSMFLDRYALTTETIGPRFQELIDVTNQGNRDPDRAGIAVAVYEALCLDLSRTAAARIGLAQALAHLGKPREAVEVLEEFVKTLEEWDKQKLRDRFRQVMKFQGNYRQGQIEGAWTSPETFGWLELAVRACLGQIKRLGGPRQ